MWSTNFALVMTGDAGFRATIRSVACDKWVMLGGSVYMMVIARLFIRVVFWCLFMDCAA